jgi:hypothetical protein
MFNDTGHVKISDMGLTIQLKPGKAIKHLAGTAGYWAPEILSRHTLTKVTDSPKSIRLTIPSFLSI